MTAENDIFSCQVNSYINKATSMLDTKTTLLLDMNSTFMFGEDRFSDSEDYSKHYHDIGGRLPKDSINSLITDIFAYLETRYPDDKYRHNFPSVEDAINKVSSLKLSTEEIAHIINTFAFHEHGYIPEEFITTLYNLKSKFTLSAVIDIWSPKDRWLNTFAACRIDNLFSAVSFSSDHGMVKPSPKPFELVVNELGVAKENCLVIGDSIRRDLGGALSAEIDCILVGGACDERALTCYPSLLTFAQDAV
jgi:HAD superfamily hydrolase (TIGR01549 family)